MNNFEKYIANLTQEDFIESMILNCDGCPVEHCKYINESVCGSDCEEVLRSWCERKM